MNDDWAPVTSSPRPDCTPDRATFVTMFALEGDHGTMPPLRPHVGHPMPRRQIRLQRLSHMGGVTRAPYLRTAPRRLAAV